MSRSISSRVLSQAALFGALGAVLLSCAAGAAFAHDFGGPTGPGNPPPGGDNCPGCCSGGGDPCGPGGPPCSTSGGPVNYWDGGERHVTIDVQIPGYIPISFGRIYESRTDYDSPVGFGWAHTYDYRIYRYPDNSVVLRRPCGERRSFIKSGGAYVSPDGERRNVLKDEPDGTIVFIESDGREYAFDLSGRLAALRDLNGNALEFSYDPSGRVPMQGVSKFMPDPNSPGIVSMGYRLTSIRERDALGTLTGRALTITYKANGRLDAVTDSTGRSWTYSQDALGNLTGVSRPMGTPFTYVYADPNDFHNLTSLTEATQRFTLEYDGQDRVKRQTFAPGTRYDITYGALNQTTVTKTVVDPNGAVLSTGTTSYDFNSLGNPTRLTDPLGNEFRYTRDTAGLTSRKEVRQNVPGTGLVLLKTVDLTYDALGNILTETHTQTDTGEVVTRTYQYDHSMVTRSRFTSSRNPGVVHGSNMTYAHNARGYPSRVLQESRIVSGTTDANFTFLTTTYTYNAYGQPITMASTPGTESDTFGYTNGFLTSRNGETFQVDDRGNVLTRTTPGGLIWHSAYDLLDRLTSSEDPTGAQTLMTWTGDLVTQVEAGRTVSSGGRIFRQIYDAFGRLIRVERQTAPNTWRIVNTRVMDSDGNLLQQTDGTSRTTITAYDVLGRPAAITDGSGGVTSLQYDALDNVTRSTDPAGRVTKYANWLIEQSSRKPLAITNGLNKTYTAVVDALGNLKSLTDPLNGQLTEVHDAAGRLTSFAVTGSTTSFTYTARGRILSRTAAVGGTTNYSYNTRGELVGVDYPGTDAATLTRDADGRLTQAADLDSDMSYSWDGAGRITLERNNTTGRSTTFTYDAVGLRKTISTSDGQITVYEYDDFDHLFRVRRSGKIEAEYWRDAGGQVWLARYGNATGTQYVRDGAGRVLMQDTYQDPSGPPTGSGPIQIPDEPFPPNSQYFRNRTEYTRDASGLILVKHEIIRRPDATISELYFHYTYDLALRMTREEIRDASDTTVMSARSFTYDDVGNRLTMSFDGGATTTYAYGTNYHLMSETTGGASITYTYDGNGNTLSETFAGTTVNYGYDKENRLIHVDSPSQVADYVLSWDGRRLARTSGATTTQFLYDGLNVVTEYTTGVSNVNYVTGLGLDDLILRTQGAAKSYYSQLEDLKTVAQTLDASGGVQNSYSYRAFGEQLEAVINTPNTYTFAGRSKDAESSNFYFRERLYSPRTGRFLSLDPFRPDAQHTARIGSPGRLALSSSGVQATPLFDQRRDVNVNGMDTTGYLYVGNNPVNASDPTGEVLIWNQASGSLTSGCWASGCLISVCVGSGCIVSKCIGSGCGGSGCGGSVCGGSACGASACQGSGCVGTGCVGSVCFTSGCAGSLCGGSVCIGSMCGGSGCIGSLCGGSACVASVCSGSTCAGSGCIESACGGSSCTHSGCYYSGCTGSGCTHGGCDKPCPK